MPPPEMHKQSKLNGPSCFGAVLAIVHRISLPLNVPAVQSNREDLAVALVGKKNQRTNAPVPNGFSGWARSKKIQQC